MLRPRGSDLLALGVAALAARVAAALAVGYPPYTDPAYYAMVAQQLVSGHGFSAPVLWSFLEVGGRLPAHPVLPVPSNGHWMPLTSVVAAFAMAALGPTWQAGQVPMIVLSAALVPLTYLVGIELWGSRRVAWLAALLAIFAGPLLILYPTVDNFAVFGACGAAALYAAVRALRGEHRSWWLVASGVGVGLATLARVDGLLLAVAPATAWLADRGWGPWQGAGERRLGWWTLPMAAAAAIVVLAPWLGRNLEVFGSAFPSAGGHTLWITSYNQQFSISADPTLAGYLAWGPLNIIGSKLEAWWEIGWRTVVLLGGVFAVFFVAGLWRERRRPALAPFVAYFVVMFVAMGLVFTFHAPKGAFYHSSGAWLPFALALSAASLGPTCQALGRWWRFLARPATQRFVAGAGLAGAVALSLLGSVALLRIWDAAHQKDMAAAAFLRGQGATTEVAMYADPPSLWHLTGGPAVVSPFDPYPVLEQVVRAYDVRWVVVALREGASIDPLGLWNGGRAVDGDGNTATWLSLDPAFEAPGVRVFAVVDGP